MASRNQTLPRRSAVANIRPSGEYRVMKLRSRCPSIKRIPPSGRSRSQRRAARSEPLLSTFRPSAEKATRVTPEGCPFSTSRGELPSFKVPTSPQILIVPSPSAVARRVPSLENPMAEIGAE